MRTSVLRDADPLRWADHRYGLSPKRWESLRGAAFWVTGAGTGFGRALSVALACAGSDVFLTGRRQSKLDETADEARRVGAQGRCRALPADVSSEDRMAAAAAAIDASGASLHGVVASAAVSQQRRSCCPLLDEDTQCWRRMLDVNLLGPWLAVKYAAPLMARTGGLRALFLSSGAGWSGTAGFGHYNVSKAALNNLCLSFAAECAERYPEADVQINTVDPGEARTEMNQGSATSPYSLASMALLLLSHPAHGPNGKFFHRDGGHLPFCSASPYEHDLSAAEL